MNPKKERKRRREAGDSGETRRSKKKSGGPDDEGEVAEAEAAALEDKYLKAYAKRGAKSGGNPYVRKIYLIKQTKAFISATPGTLRAMYLELSYR